MVLTVFVLIALLLSSPWSFVALAVGLVAEGGEIAWGRRLARKPSATMIGATARVVEACRPSGTVQCMGELWAAVCPAGAGVGESVVVVGRRDLVLEVAPADPASVHPNGAMSG
jgi:membrane-bound ClpP family serine protease